MAATAPQFVAKHIKVADHTYPYSVWLPPGYNAKQKWPVILFLHGKGECGVDGERHTQTGLGRWLREHPERFPAIVILPQIPVDTRWEEPAMQDVALAALDATLKEYPADPKRVTLTGLSLGGFGTWALGARAPERFRGLMPVCGGGDPASAKQLAKLPIWCFHGDADDVVVPERSRIMVEAVRAAGGHVRYDELPGVNHNAWDPAYGNPEADRWLLAPQP